MSSIAERAAWRGLSACALLACGLLLDACGGSGRSSQPLQLATTASASSTPVGRGDTATFTFTVTNGSRDDVDSVEAGAWPDGWLKTQAITCTAQGGTCPTMSGTGVTPTFRMPAGSVFTFVVQAQVAGDKDGPVQMTLLLDSYERMGRVLAVAEATSVDKRDGYYEIFTAAGLRKNLVVEFGPDSPNFAVNSAGGDHTFTADPTGRYYSFPSGGHMLSAPDLLTGQADFGSGPDTFIAVRELATLPELDGLGFSTFNVARGVAAGAVDPVTGASGPLGIWQVAIAGTTMTVCTQPIGAIATCDPAHLRQYALSVPQPGQPVITATDTVHNDSFTFQVARSGSSLIYLRADVAPADALFSIGFANATLPTGPLDALGTLGDKFAYIDLDPTFWEFLSQNPAGDFGPSTVMPLAADNSGIPGLLRGTRPSDGADVYFLQQGALTLAGTLGGEFGIAVVQP